VSTADDTFAVDHADHGRAAPATRAIQRFGRIVVVGGGCYGSYYVRQLGRAARAGALDWRTIVVVDRDPDCAVARLTPDDRPIRLELATSEWEPYFAAYLATASGDPTARDDAIVPSPLMPHLLADWLVARARARWPARRVETVPLDGAPDVPWQRLGADGTHYVSFAEWMCPINCIEPARCPETRGTRSWSLPIAVQQYVDRSRSAGGTLEPPLVFHCAHRAYGVGMIDVRDVLDADATIAARGGDGGAGFLIGTVSHCHGALRRVEISA
jgi:hypothetical protein